MLIWFFFNLIKIYWHLCSYWTVWNLIVCVCFSDQLNEIKKTSLAKIMCENLDIQYIQRDPLSFVSEK